jgi:mannitol/fructose-specific phosphotransferase system IIA component (Ntr-type)
VDARGQEEFIMNGVNFMVELGYVSPDLAEEVDTPEELFDWSAMEAVIADNPDLYASLERKSGE